MINLNKTMRVQLRVTKKVMKSSFPNSNIFESKWLYKYF